MPANTRRVLASLYERHPATPQQLADRTVLPPGAVSGSLAQLRAIGLLRGGVPRRDGSPGYVWLDLAAFLSALHGQGTPAAADTSASRPSADASAFRRGADASAFRRGADASVFRPGLPAGADSGPAVASRAPAPAPRRATRPPARPRRRPLPGLDPQAYTAQGHDGGAEVHA